MSSGLVTVTGPGYIGNNQATAGEMGGGYVIGDGYVLTAGHVIYEWDRVYPTVAPNIVTNPGLSVIDYRGSYSSRYAQAVTAELSVNPTAPVANEIIEGRISSGDTPIGGFAFDENECPRSTPPDDFDRLEKLSEAG